MGSSASYRTTAVVGSIVAAVAALLLAGAWASYLDVRPQDAPRSLARDGAAGREQAAEPKETQYDKPFSERMVTDRVEWTYLGKDTIDVALINPTEGADLDKTARACLDRYLPGHDFAQCYVFASRREYDHKNITSQLELPKDTPKTGLVILCYSHLGRQERGKDPVIANMHDAPQTWRAQGCPGW